MFRERERAEAFFEMSGSERKEKIYICRFGLERAEAKKTKSASERERAERNFENCVSRAGASSMVSGNERERSRSRAICIPDFTTVLSRSYSSCSYL